MAEIRKVIQQIYHLDYSGCEVPSGEEMIITSHGNEFTNTFIMRDLDKGIIVTPKGYSRGLMFKVTDGGELVNPPEWNPDIVTFSLNIFGMKKNAFYRITVKGKNTRKYNRVLDVTDDRAIEVSDASRALILRHDFSNDESYATANGIYRSESNEADISFRMGKICLKDIIIEEVELASDDKPEENDTSGEFSFDIGKTNMCAFGCWSPIYSDNIGRYHELSRITGKGLLLFYDDDAKEYVLERDNNEDTVNDSFTKANYLVDVNMAKMPMAYYLATDVDMEPSPNTLKSGYIRFRLMDAESHEPIRYENERGRLSISIYKIN